jgi:cellulase (glycosyl hydrolase family 5)
VRVLLVNLRLVVALGVLAMATPAHASPVSAHAMVHTCCTPDVMKERIFDEAEAAGSDFIRVDVEMSAIFEGPGGKEAAEPDWKDLDDVMELAREHDLQVLGVLLNPPAYISTCPERWPDAGRCAAADTDEFGRLAGEIAEHAKDTIHHWEIVNEPDGDWAFEGTPEQYAAMLSAAHDGIKARVPDARIVFGGLMRPRDPAWLERVLATPGADAIHKFDIASVHLRGPVDLVVNRYSEFRAWIGGRGFNGPLWVTEHGYPADPAYQVDPAFTGGDAGQAAYLTQSLVGLGEAGAPQVFVTLRDNLEGEYASEGLVHIDGGPEAATARRASFGAMRRLAMNWDQIMAWRREQRENERLAQLCETVASVEAGEARTARVKFEQARVQVHEAQDAFVDAPRSARVKKRLLRRVARARAMVAGRRTALLWHRAYARWQRGRADQHRLAVEALKAQIAGT